MCKAMERIKAEGKTEGLAEGKREGLAEGKREGLAEGKREGKRETMLETAKRMLKSGMLALKDIAKFSGLSLAEVKELQASMA